LVCQLPQDEDAFLDAEGVGDEDDEEEEDDEDDEDEEGASDDEDEDGADLDASALALAAGADRAASAAALVAMAGMQARLGLGLLPTYFLVGRWGRPVPTKLRCCRGSGSPLVQDRCGPHCLPHARQPAGQLIRFTGPPGAPEQCTVSPAGMQGSRGRGGAEAPAAGAAGLRRLRTV